MTVLPAKPLSAPGRIDGWGVGWTGSRNPRLPKGETQTGISIPPYSICSLISCSQARRAVAPAGAAPRLPAPGVSPIPTCKQIWEPYVSVSNNYLMSQLCVKYRCQQTDISIFVCAHLENSRPLVPYSSALSWSMRTEAPRIAWCTSMARRMLFANGAFYDAQWAVCHSAC